MTHKSDDPADTAPASSGQALATSPQTSHTTRQDGWTIERQLTFLRALASSHSVAEAARAAGMSRQSAYALRARLKGEPFDLAWHSALRCRFDALAEIALERAMHGTEVPHFYKGELIGTSRKFDERLTVALLLMRDKLGAPYMRSTHPGFAFRAEKDGSEFARLMRRIERGPDTWDEESRMQLEEAQSLLECPHCGSEYECDCEEEEDEDADGEDWGEDERDEGED
ncbi:hypothetical protein [Erythrobacter sp. THAF29]|uniref:hypothetical protein n=1 Tax=Erythrobacter sp. THAF29 TaxID=2587851 RepID=UPI001268836B|nr:hypothetical protein [Erythrobacter sp. THAF29]QFT78802.1 hypothetical protein FIU90_14725 [Erythrobacter sp. THAF29]